MNGGDSKSVIVFQIFRDKAERSNQFCFKRESSNGEVPEQGDHAGLRWDTGLDSSFSRHPKPMSAFSTIVPTSGYSTIWSSLKPSTNYPGFGWELARICYDLALDRLALKFHTVRGLGNNVRSISLPVYWKTVARCRVNISGTVKVIDLDTLSATSVAQCMNHVDNAVTTGTDIQYQQLLCEGRFQGDVTFLHNYYGCRVVVWCFDKTITISNHRKALSFGM